MKELSDMTLCEKLCLLVGAATAVMGVGLGAAYFVKHTQPVPLGAVAVNDTVYVPVAVPTGMDYGTLVERSPTVTYTCTYTVYGAPQGYMYIASGKDSCDPYVTVPSRDVLRSVYEH